MFFITRFTSFGTNKRAMYCNFCSNLPWFNKVFYLSRKSNQFTNRSPLLYAGAYETRTWPQKTGNRRPFETLDYPIGNSSSQCRNPWFRTSSILHPVSGDVQLYFAPSRLQKVSSLRLHLSNGFLGSPAVCNALTWKRCGIISHQLAYVAPLQPICYSSALCWGVLSAVSSCRTPFLKNVYKLIPLRCTPSTGTKSHNGLLLELSSVVCSFHTWDTKIRFSTYCLWSNHQPVFSWTTFAGFVFQGGHIFVHSFIGLFIISLTVQMVQPCPLVVTFLFESNIYFTPISVSIATFRPLLPFTRSTGFTTGT